MYRSAIKAWRNRLAWGSLSAAAEPWNRERMAQTALLLGVGRTFGVRLKRSMTKKGETASAPLLQPGVLAAFAYTAGSWNQIKDSLPGTVSSGSDSGSSYGGGDSGGGGDGGTGAD
jgi:uncharacterized membrane protein YgcG